MALRAARKDDAMPVHVEVARPDELPRAVPAPHAGPAAPPAPRNRGRFTSASAVEAARKSHLARERSEAERDPHAWAKKLGVSKLLSDERFPKDEAIKPFIVEAEQWMAATMTSLAADVGGGSLSPHVVSMIRSAAMQRAFSAFLFECAASRAFAWAINVEDRGEDKKVTRAMPKTELAVVASRLANDSRQNMLCAFEVAAREAAARREVARTQPYDLGAALRLADGKGTP